MFVAVVIVGNGAVTGQAHSGHIPSDVDVEVFGGGVADVAWVGMFTIHSSAPVAPGQEVTGMIEFVQDWSGTSSQSWEVAPATVSPDFSQSDRDVTFAWWAVVPHFTRVVMGPDATVGQVVDDGFVDMFWNTVSLGFGSESFDERGFGLRSVGGEDVLFMKVHKFGFRESSELSNRSWRLRIGEADESESGDEFHGS